MNDFDRLTIARGEHAQMAPTGIWNAPARPLRTLLMAAAVLPAIFALQACKSANERAAELAQQADAFAQAGNVAAARSAIAEAIALREDEPSFHQLQGVIAMRAGDPIGAYRAFNRALEFDATNRMALAYVANIGVQIGQVSEAEEAADKLLTLQPNALPALQVKGMIALSREKYEEATTYGDQILAADPTDEAGSIIKARALAKAGQAEEALKLIDTAMLNKRGSAALLTNKVNLYRYLGQAEPMVEPLNELVRLSNGSPQVRLDQINILYRVGRADEARRAALALLTAGSRDPNDYRTLQRIWWQYDKTPFPEGVARNARNWKAPLALVATVRYLFWKNDLAAADALMRSAPANAQPLLASLRARYLLASGREQEARKQIDELLAKDDQDVDALMLKARFAAQDKDMQVALESAQKAQTNDPQNPETYIALAGVYRAQGAGWRVRQVFEEGLKTLPQNFYLMETYLQYLREQGDRARAVSATRAFARALPSSERAWEMMGTQCQWAQDAACLQSAFAGYQGAKKTFVVDDPPGTPPNKGLFGRI